MISDLYMSFSKLFVKEKKHAIYMLSKVFNMPEG